MRVAFAGTPAFAVPALRAIRACHDVVLVLTQPDRPAGRGMKLKASAVAEAAGELGLPIEKPESLRSADAESILRRSGCDVMVVAAYGMLLPESVLRIPPRGCLNIHASLLPRWRGAAPVHRALLAGDPETGVCIMRMEAGLDTGPVLLERRTAIGDDDTTGILTERLARLGAEAVVEALDRLDSLLPQVQDHARATYAAKIRKAEAVVDWLQPAVDIARRVRAFNPAPGVEARVGDETAKLWSVEVVPGSGRPGTLVAGAPGLVVACGQDALRILELQRPGGRRIKAEDFLRGSPRAVEVAGPIAPTS